MHVEITKYVHSNTSTEAALLPSRCHKARQYALKNAYNSLTDGTVQ